MARRLNAEIDASKVALEKTLLNSGVAISQQDLNLRYTHFFNTHPGVARENLLGKTEADWLPPDEAKQLTTIKKRALAGKKGARQLFKSSLGSGRGVKTYFNDIRVEPIKEGSEVVGIYTVAIDVTKYNSALMKLTELNGRLLKYMETQLDK